MENAIEKPERRLTLKDPENFEVLNQITTEFRETEAEMANHFMVAALKANAIRQMKKILTDEFVKVIKDNLENTKLGFKTDRKEGGYPLETIRRCLIECALNGIYWHGNEFNILADNFYITREGFFGKMSRDPRFKNIKLSTVGFHPSLPLQDQGFNFQFSNAQSDSF